MSRSPTTENKGIPRSRRAPSVKKSNSRGRPKAQDDTAARRRILDTALKVFSLSGFDGVSIADVARCHEVSAALIHYYFDNKEELWWAALDSGIGDVLSNLEETMYDSSGFDCVDRLKFFIRRYIAIVAERPEAFRIIIRETETPGPRLSRIYNRYLTPLYALFTELVERAQSEGKLKFDLPSYHYCQIIAGASSHFIASRNRMLEAYGVDPMDRDVRERHTNAVIEFLFNGMLRTPNPT